MNGWMDGVVKHIEKNECDNLLINFLQKQRKEREDKGEKNEGIQAFLCFDNQEVISET
jgi:hypothetical protein